MGGRGAYWSGKSKDYETREFDTIGFAHNGLIKILKKRDNVDNIHFPLYSNTPNTTYFVMDNNKSGKIGTVGIYRNHRLVESIDLTDSRGEHWHEWKTKIMKNGNETQAKTRFDNFDLKPTHRRLIKYAKDWESGV